MNTQAPFYCARLALGTALRWRVWLALGGVLLVGSACAPLPQKVVVDFAEPRPGADQEERSAAAAAHAPTGGIFRASNYRPAFEDSRARLRGDIVTIQIVENLAASQVTKSTVNRDTSSTTAITPPLPGILAADLNNLNGNAATTNDFTGKGDNEAANTFAGSISATVIDVLPNGNLVVAGEKQIGVNQYVDVMRFSGTIDPRQLQPGNLISSTQVANVRIESKGRGAQAEANTFGWLSRFFLNFSPF